MNREIFLIGSGQTRFGELWDSSLRDLMDEAVSACLEESACSPLAIDLIVVGNMLGERLSDQAHLGGLASSLLPHHPPALRVESACASGAVAIATACAMLESGRVQTVLVLGVEKMTDASIDDVSQGLMGAADAERDRSAGLTFPGIFGLIARRYMHDYGLTREQLSLVSAVHHRQARDNPYAQFRQELSPEVISGSPLVADPLRLLDCSPISDGAAAVLLSTKRRGSARVLASSLATDNVSLADRSQITSFSATKDGVEKALREAEILRSDVQFLETHDCFSIAAVMNLEDLGFAEEGEGIGVYDRLYRGGPTHDQLTVNASGGLKACGHPVAATGVKQLIDLHKQLAAGSARYGMTHNFGGACATCAIHILENLDV